MGLSHPGPIPGGGGYRGHAHFWQRAMARRRFMRGAAGTAALLAAGLQFPALVEAGAGSQVLPQPIPGGSQFLGPGTELFHVFPPGPDVENATITDFNGAIAAAHILGTATQTQGGTSTALQVDHDLRFMQGVYVGVDGQVHRGTFGFF